MAQPIGVTLEQENALQDAADYLFERGMEITLLQNDETTITRGRYNSIKKREPVEIVFHAYPVKYSPTDDELREAGIREKVDVILTLATKHLTDASISYDIIDTGRYELLLNGNLYTIADKNKINHFSFVHLNVVLGLFKK